MADSVSLFVRLAKSKSESLLNEGELRSEWLLDEDAGESARSTGISPSGYWRADGGLYTDFGSKFDESVAGLAGAAFGSWCAEVYPKLCNIKY